MFCVFLTGMSESTGATTMTAWVDDNKHWKPNSAGYLIPGYGNDLLDQDEKGHGEIAMVGRHVFMGYLGEEEKTKDTFDSEYRLKSGDVGFRDKDGFLFISGRIKGNGIEILIAHELGFQGLKHCVMLHALNLCMVYKNDFCMQLCVCVCE